MDSPTDLRLFSIVILSSSLIIGCGATEEDKSNRRDEIIAQEFEHHEPAAYTLADPSCQAVKGQDITVDTGWLYRWSATDVVLEKRKLSDLRMNPATLESPALKRTTYADTFERTCDASLGSDRACLRPSGTEKGFKPKGSNFLRYCESETKYERHTYEGVGLHAAEYLTHAHEAWVKHGPALDIDRVHLSVLPNFVTYYDNYETLTPATEPSKIRLKHTMTHNAMYLPAIDMIAVLPERKINVEDLSGFFWESPFVLAHEFGHHVEFEMRDRKALADLALHWNPATHAYTDPDPIRLTGNGGSGKALVAGAFSEAFADLLAYYSADGAADSLIGLPCFGESRDIGRSTFGDETPKVLSKPRVAMLLGGTSPEVGCGQPDFTDIHIHGAMLAYTLNRSFAQLTEAAQIEAQSDVDFGERYRLTIAWMTAASENLRGLVDADAASATLFQAAATGLEQAIEGWLPAFSLQPGVSASDVKTIVCEAVATDWPAVEAPPFIATQGCEQ